MCPISTTVGSQWIGKTSSKKMACCILCKQGIDIGTGGSGALDSHMKGAKPSNKEKAKKKDVLKSYFVNDEKSSGPSHLSVDSNSSKKKSAGVANYFISDNTLNAEILWCLNIVMSHFSYNSCIGLNQLFKLMFPDSEVAANFALRKTKCRYLLMYGIFSKQNLND